MADLTSSGRRVLSTLTLLIIICCLWAAGSYILTAPVLAAETNGGLTYSEVMMDPGKTYDISKNKKATWMTASESGTYRIVGKSSVTLLLIHARSDSDINIIFGDSSQGVRLVATKDCPGTLAKARSAITVEGEKGGKITLTSAAGQDCYFRAKGGVPAIRKDSTNVELVFDTEDTKNPGTFEVHADANAEKTSGIGCYSNLFNRNTFGNVIFRSGKIRAYGSENSILGGGPGIGADMYGQVNGIIFENADVEAYAGSGSSAAIGTASAYVFMPFAPNPSAGGGSAAARGADPKLGDEPDDPVGDRVMGIVCQNITIRGGSVKAIHDRNINGGEQNGGAGIGGGWGSHSDSIIIEGGTVTAQGTYNAAGIGGGNEGNCNGFNKSKHAPSGYDGGNHGVIIRGGKVRAIGGSAGIGSGTAYGETADKDNFRFGDCRVVIEGGEVTAEASDENGVGIGGWKGEDYDPVMKVTVSGGKVKASAKSCAIGAAYAGAIQNISISGGRVNAVSDLEDTPVIGSEGAKNSRSTSSFCKAVNITGGTVTATNKGKAGPGLIGGYRDDKGNTPVYISGGNVCGEIYKSTAQRSSGDGTAVYPNAIALKGYGLNSVQRSMDDIAIKKLGFDGGDTEYGLHDAFLISSDSDADPVMYIWLPEGVSTGFAETDPAFLKYGLGLRKEEVTAFQGMTESGKGGTLYPGYWFLFDDNYNTKDTGTACAFAYIGDKEVRENTFCPEVVTTDDGRQVSPSAYTVDKERQVPLLNADGSFVKNVSSGGTNWTDSEGRLLLTSSDPARSDRRDLQNSYLDGSKLYGRWESYALCFDSNRPVTASTEMTGSMASATHEYDDELTIPECRYSLPGYSFRGWAGEAGSIYKPGDKVMPSELDPNHTGKITLYAQWEPCKYSITFSSGEAGMAPDFQEAVFDEPGTLKTVSEIGWEYTGHSFHGWTVQNKPGSLFDDGEDFCNFCSLDESGRPIGRILEACWASEGMITVSVTCNGSTVSGLGSSIIITDGSSEFRLPFTEQNGVYAFDPQAGAVPAGKYHLIIDNDRYPVTDEAGAFAYDGTKPVSIILDYYTVTAAAGDEHISSVFLTEHGGFEMPLSEITVLDDSKIMLEAKAASGYHVGRFAAFGVEPIWDPSEEAQVITVRGQADIKAFSEANTYTVHFDANGGKGYMPDQDMIYSQPQYLQASEFSRKGYEFSGWNTKADGSGEAFADRQKVINLTDDNGAEVVLHAQWEPVIYPIRYELAGGYMPEGKENPATYTAEDDDIKLVDPEREDHAFAGWTGSELSGLQKSVTIPKGSSGDREYTANWKLKEFTVTFNTGGGSSVAEQTVKIHETAKRPKDPVRSGFVFADWYSDRQLTQKYDFSYEILADTNLYAGWIKKPAEVYDITFDLNGGVLNGQTGKLVIRGTEGEIITIPSAPEKEGYRFLYWKGSRYYPGDKYRLTGEHTFTAMWKKVSGNHQGDPDRKSRPGGGTETGDSVPVGLIAVLAIAAVMSGAAVVRRRK